ncbi:hypothetical protein GGD38_003598 [Chitinophagaceae bacterium OAS944]|nr:hypothetical protein [Chitinophagaceae bacterium OAS944]
MACFFFSDSSKNFWHQKLFRHIGKKIIDSIKILIHDLNPKMQLYNFSWV